MSILNAITAFQNFARTVTANGKSESGGGGFGGGGYDRSSNKRKEKDVDYMELMNRKNSFGYDSIRFDTPRGFKVA